MKVKHAIIFLIVGYCTDFVGALFKILHHAYGDAILSFALTLKVIGGLVLLYKLLTYPKIKDFLNW